MYKKLLRSFFKASMTAWLSVGIFVVKNRPPLLAVGHTGVCTWKCVACCLGYMSICPLCQYVVRQTCVKNLLCECYLFQFCYYFFHFSYPWYFSRIFERNIEWKLTKIKHVQGGIFWFHMCANLFYQLLDALYNIPFHFSYVYYISIQNAGKPRNYSSSFVTSVGIFYRNFISRNTSEWLTMSQRDPHNWFFIPSCDEFLNEPIDFDE